VVGGPADATGARLYALASAQWKDPGTGAAQSAWGPVLVMLNRADLTALKADAPTYLSRLSSETPSADVSGFVLAHDDESMLVAGAKSPSSDSRRIRVMRTLEGWRLKPV